MPSNPGKNLTAILAALNMPAVQSVIAVLEPYIPVLKRQGLAFAQSFLDQAVAGNWVKAMEQAWPLMTTAEKDAASQRLLLEAQKATDDAFEMNLLAKEIAIKLAFVLLASLI